LFCVASHEADMRFQAKEMAGVGAKYTPTVCVSLRQ
jgi:hypothetical protein